MGYFRELPELDYQSFLSDSNSSSRYLRVKNLFRRTKIRDDLQNVFTLFNKYQIKEGARPDTVAEEFYGNAELDYVVIITAGIINVRDEWPLSSKELYNYSLDIYGDYLTDVHHWETKEVKDLNGKLILPKGKIVIGRVLDPGVKKDGKIVKPPKVELREGTRELTYEEMPEIKIVGGSGHGAKIIPSLLCLGTNALAEVGSTKVGTGRYVDCP